MTGAGTQENIVLVTKIWGERKCQWVKKKKSSAWHLAKTIQCRRSVQSEGRHVLRADNGWAIN